MSSVFKVFFMARQGNRTPVYRFQSGTPPTTASPWFLFSLKSRAARIGMIKRDKVSGPLLSGGITSNLNEWTVKIIVKLQNGERYLLRFTSDAQDQDHFTLLLHKTPEV